jgi:hypothetical protein
MGRLKAPRHHVALGDCCCVALALRVSGEVETCDHPDFDPFVRQGVCPVRFLR